jgi:eukaryotic-like serine/threonine-protein kinase
MSQLLGGRYRLGDMIGTGGMADVFEAKDERLSRKVAVKILRSDLAKDPSFVTRFRKEALAAAGLNHPGIVAVYDSGEDPAPYIVMELVSGKTLREIIRAGGRLPLDRALEIGEGILAALDYSHERGIVHRDVKVMDFGIARALDDLAATLTNTWNVVGTAQYLSPEQAVGEVADARSDIYSAGCLLYEVITGQPPFTGDTPVSIAYQHVSGEFLLPSSVLPGLPEGIDVMLSVALSKRPIDRYQSAGLMLDDLFRIHSGQVVKAKIARKPITRKTLVIGLIGLLIVSGAAVFGLNMSNTGSTGGPSNSVPNVIGLTQAEAKAQLGDYVVTVQRAHDPQIPVDRVSNQIPVASAQAKSGSAVVLTLSDGPGDALVPDGLIGLSLGDARAVLTSVGLVVARTEVSPSGKPQGTVLAVTPEMGSTVTAGTGVVLTIANGEVEIPNLIGVEAIQARAILINSNFLIKEFNDYDPAQAIGVVIRQFPEAGATRTIGESVTITINKAP